MRRLLVLSGSNVVCVCVYYLESFPGEVYSAGKIRGVDVYVYSGK